MPDTSNLEAPFKGPAPHVEAPKHEPEAAKPREEGHRIPVIALVGADKGGVGKTTVARALIDYAVEHGTHPRLIDTQVPKGGLKGFYPQAELVDIVKPTGQMAIFDKPAPLTVIDVGAGLLARTVAVLERVGLLADARQGKLRVVLLYLLGPSVASLSEVVEAGKTIGDKVNLFLIRNHISEGDDYFGWESDPRFATALAAMAPITVDVPNLEQRAAEAVQQEGQPFSSFWSGSFTPISPENVSRILQGYVRAWFNDVRNEFNRIALDKTLAL